MSFEKLNLIEELQKSLREEDYTIPTPIQEKAIPIILKQRDLIGCAQTGTGKTAAFALPILQLLHTSDIVETGKKQIKTLIITPTRELAIQIGESFTSYGRHTNIEHAVIFGGVSYRAQRRSLENGIDVLIATPGRLIDLMNQGFVDLKHLSIFVLDEADRMLDMGFIHDIRKILKVLPTKRQSLFFSATMPPEIVKLAENILYKPIKVEVTPVSSTADTIQQSVYFVDTAYKKDLLIHVLKDKAIVSALVFTRTKHGADKVTKLLRQHNITAEAIHGNKSQNNRQLALNNFKDGITRVLVATDIAARGIDIDNLSHVINYEIPNISETYVHRIGRTGRAGADGISLSFCSNEERAFLKDIHKLISKIIPTVEDHPFPIGKSAPAPSKLQPEQPITKEIPDDGLNSRERHKNKLANELFTAKATDNRKRKPAPKSQAPSNSGSAKPNSPKSGSNNSPKSANTFKGSARNQPLSVLNKAPRENLDSKNKNSAKSSSGSKPNSSSKNSSFSDDRKKTGNSSSGKPQQKWYSRSK